MSIVSRSRNGRGSGGDSWNHRSKEVSLMQLMRLLWSVSPTRRLMITTAQLMHGASLRW
jgi:hypothetical protein